MSVIPVSMECIAAVRRGPFTCDDTKSQQWMSAEYDTAVRPE